MRFGFIAIEVAGGREASNKPSLRSIPLSVVFLRIRLRRLLTARLVISYY